MKGLDLFYGPGGEGRIRRVGLLDRLQRGERIYISVPGHDAHCTLAEGLVLAIERISHLR